MNHFSFQSEEDNQSHCLGLQIGSEQIGDWRGNSSQRCQIDGEVQTGILSEFDMNLSEPEDIIPSFSRQSECPEFIQAFEVDQEKPEATTAEKSQALQQSKQVDEVSQVTVFEQTNISTTITRDSVIEQRWKTEGSTIYSEFMSICQNNYDILLKHFKNILHNTKAYSDNSIVNLDMYCLFFKIKLKQEEKRYKNIKNVTKEVKLKLNDNLLLQAAYLDQKIVMNQLISSTDNRKQIIYNYCEQLQQISNKFSLLLSKAIENRKNKIQQIQSQIERVERIEQQLIQLIRTPQNKEEGGVWIGKSDIKCDRYLQRKYLFERQSLFLSLVKSTGQMLVNLLNSIFVKQQPIIYAIINRQMIRYSKISKDTYQTTLQSTLSKLNNQEITKQFTDIVNSIIPQDIRQESEQNNNSEHFGYEKLISQLHSYLQNQIFLPIVQLSQEYILFKSQAKWLSRTGQNANLVSPSDVKQHEKQNHNTKMTNTTLNNCQVTCNALITERQKESVKTQLMSVAVVVTIDKYLHLQCGEKIATLKLRRLKLSKKGKSIMVSEKNSTFATFFASILVLGQIAFSQDAAAQKFIEVVQKCSK